MEPMAPMFTSGNAQDVKRADRGWHSNKTTKWTVQLGYMNIEDKWQLAVRTVQTKQGEHEARESGTPQPLIKATRSLRIEALDLLPRLTKAIKDRVQALISSIQKAKEAHAHIVL